MDLLEAIMSAANRGWNLHFGVDDRVLYIEATTVRDGKKWVSDCRVLLRDLQIASHPGQYVGSKIMEITDDSRAK